MSRIVTENRKTLIHCQTEPCLMTVSLRKPAPLHIRGASVSSGDQNKHQFSAGLYVKTQMPATSTPDNVQSKHLPSNNLGKE